MLSSFAWPVLSLPPALLSSGLVLLDVLELLGDLVLMRRLELRITSRENKMKCITGLLKRFLCLTRVSNVCFFAWLPDVDTADMAV